jgi:hypothetical protein
MLHENILSVVPLSDVLKRLNAVGAGPPVTAPVVENVDPWLGQKKRWLLAWKTTEVPWCVQACETAMYWSDKVLAMMIPLWYMNPPGLFSELKLGSARLMVKSTLAGGVVPPPPGLLSSLEQPLRQAPANIAALVRPSWARNSFLSIACVFSVNK